uniref:Uncharacterized protein n=1 Tax=Rhizophora mucronata TaxID=61149 RepID=A0A2P2MLE3_RHIMU
MSRYVSKLLVLEAASQWRELKPPVPPQEGGVGRARCN